MSAEERIGISRREAIGGWTAEQVSASVAEQIAEAIGGYAHSHDFDFYDVRYVESPQGTLLAFGDANDSEARDRVTVSFHGVEVMQIDEPLVLLYEDAVAVSSASDEGSVQVVTVEANKLTIERREL